ncbi:gliding motility-associated C-terminal domain-containing protein [Flavobacterium sp. LS2P90]|uniref:Gliding motility-associated C-terminal domain-containing protein n=1 Tax=Flavobacterium xylosi TaxID=3230415 RepID=A0ABW6HXH9_9FLAO
MITLLNKYFFCFFVLLLANSIDAQIVIGTPTLPFSQICANPSFNTFNVTFSFSPVAGLSATNQFIVELSDPNGSFNSPKVVFTSGAGAVTVSPATLTFSVPITTAGEKYRLRIRSTSPAATGPNSVAFAAYYKAQDTPFSINNFGSTATYCSGGSYVLTIDNPGVGSNDSPLKYPSLTYNWFKEPSLTPIATGQSLNVNQPGKYYVETNYGTCTSNSYSNRVTVNEATSTAATTITSSLGNPFCSSAGSTTLTTSAGNNYQWYKNSLPISGATSQTYVTNQIGSYSVAVNFGTCVANASINLQDYQFSSSINIPDTNTISPDETLAVIVTTSASNPDYKWYLNGAIITGASGSTYDVKNKGSYKVEITQTTGCITSSEISFVVNSTVDPNPFPDVINIPNLISPNDDGINDTWIIPQEYVSGTNTEVVLLSSLGETVLKTNDYQNNWPENKLDFKNVNQVYYYIITTQDNKVKKGSITVLK